MDDACFAGTSAMFPLLAYKKITQSLRNNMASYAKGGQVALDTIPPATLKWLFSARPKPVRVYFTAAVALHVSAPVGPMMRAVVVYDEFLN
jgi:hypothetical protein